MRSFILEGDVLQPNLILSIWETIHSSFWSILFFSTADFTHAFKRYLHILPSINKLNKLFYRCIQLAYDVLDGQHHTQGQIPANNGSGSHNRDDDILHLIN